MKIEILCNDGSPLGITSHSLWGDDFRVGLGGSETALITLCEAWKERGDDVILYNDPHKTNESSFEQRPVSAYDPHNGEHDIVIFFRSPPLRYPMFLTTSGIKIWFTCDQQTQGDYKTFASQVDKIVCISEFHKNYFAERYGIANSIVIDLPVRVQDFENLTCEKIPKRVIFTSVPARGLDNLHRIWGRIVERVPDATLTITSDYRLWGVGASNEWAVVKWMRQPNVRYMGAMPRVQYIDELAKAELLLYVGNYEELFCISCAEAEAMGVYPITSSIGALSTTNMGKVINADADNPRNDSLFINEAVELLLDRDKLKSLQEEVRVKSIDRFNPNKILSLWDEKVFS